jgi:hypothetical protein
MRLMGDKGEKKHKQDAIDLMNKYQWKEATIVHDERDVAKVTLKVGKNNNALIDIKEIKNASDSSKEGSSD